MHLRSRPAVLAVLASLALAGSVARAGGGTPAAAPARLVVHEWGTFTTVAGADGVALDWRPLAGPTDLPSFVYGGGRPRAGAEAGGAPCGIRDCFRECACDPSDTRACPGCCLGEKKVMEASVRMETPVLYFYADRPASVAVQVGFPKGRVTEWYPQARRVGGGIDWGRVEIVPGLGTALPEEPSPSHYYPARETDAAPVRVSGAAGAQVEKFLFYRGVGTFDLPLRATLDGDRVVLENVGRDEIPAAIVFEGGARREFASLGPIRGNGGTAAVKRGRPPATTAGPDVSLERALERALAGAGLYPKEAEAMIKTWKGSWFEEGLRVFYVVPRKATDGILPLAIEPKPAETVRVLVGRAEIITPEREAAMRALVERLGDASDEARAEATEALRREGRFAEPTLKRVLGGTRDPEIRARIEGILAEGPR